MKRTLLILAVAILACAPFAAAQTGGTISLSGTIGPYFSMTTSSGANNPSATVSWTAPADIQPTTGGTLTTNDTTNPLYVYLRSNYKYKVTAAVSATFSDPGNNDLGNYIQLSDIGFGVRSTATTGDGTDVANSTVSIINTFDYHSGWPSITDGLTPFDGSANHGNLANAGTGGAQIFSGQRISKRGNISAANNALKVQLGVAVLPQFFTPGAFSTTITLSIGTQ